MNYIAHHGIKGQKWGIRRYQNEDGTLTDVGKRRYGYGLTNKGSYTYERKRQQAYDELATDLDKARRTERKYEKQSDRAFEKAQKEIIKGQKKGVGVSKKAYKSMVRMGELDQKHLRAIENRVNTEERMQKTLSELKMDPSEKRYRKAGYEYTKYLLGDSGSTGAYISAFGPAGVIGAATARRIMPKGREMAGEYRSAKQEYKNSYRK